MTSTKTRSTILALIASASFVIASVAPAVAATAAPATAAKGTVTLKIGAITVCDAKGQHCHVEGTWK